ncbi:MAG: DNA repair exonuclease, partial [Deltaproteobacteria bacterium]
MKIVHAADLHIDSPLRGVGRIEDADVDLLRRATRLAFEHLITFCLEAKADLLLLAGDLFDGEWKDSNSGVFLMRQLRRLQDVGTQV